MVSILLAISDGAASVRRNRLWRQEVDGFPEPQPRALAMENLLGKCFGDLGA